MPDSQSPAGMALSRLLGCHPDSLPTLPVTAQEVIRITSDPDGDVNQIVAAIRRDPPIAAKLLTLSNSAAFRTGQEITTLERAVAMLGFLEVRNLVLGVSLLTNLGGMGSLKRRIARARLWQHSLVAAVLAERLARDCLDMAPGYYIFGLLHDLGKVALDAFRPDDMGKILAALDAGGLTWSQAESQVVRFDHAFLGGQLMAFWELPQALVAGVSRHHDPWAETEHQEAAGLVFLADLMAHRLGHHCHQREPSPMNAGELGQAEQEFLAARGWDLEQMVERLGGDNTLAKLAREAADMGPEHTG